MSKFNNLKSSFALACFSNVCGDHFAKLCQDIDSNLGRLEKDIVTKSSAWVAGPKNSIVSKDGNKLFLPLNAPWTTLLRFGLQLIFISQAGSTDEPKYNMTIQAELPAGCKDWFQAKYREGKATADVIPDLIVK